MRDIDAEAADADERFDADAMIGRPVAEATDYYQSCGFLVVSQESHVMNLSRCEAYLQRIGVAELLGSCDRRRPAGHRDFAILTVLARLGLRAGEVAALRLGDIDWRAGELAVHGKASRQDRLPLTATALKAATRAWRRSTRCSGLRPCAIPSTPPSSHGYSPSAQALRPDHRAVHGAPRDRRLACRS
jgi:integrase